MQLVIKQFLFIMYYVKSPGLGAKDIDVYKENSFCL